MDLFRNPAQPILLGVAVFLLVLTAVDVARGRSFSSAHRTRLLIAGIFLAVVAFTWLTGPR